MSIRKRISDQEWAILKNYREPEGILVVGDLHHPFTLSGYLEHCEHVYKKYNCKEVVFVGDILDNHYSSYHETDPDGHSAGAELKLAIFELRKWYKAFPTAKVCIGNHDLIPNRKAMTAGLSSVWVRSIEEVIGAYGWKFAVEHIIDDIKYTHGTGRKARNRVKDDFVSIVQGHYHSESYIEWFFGSNYALFAMQVGSGINHKAYAMAYGKNFKKMHINCAVVLEQGKLPILENMKL